ncbi:DNA polymerase beta superfamily protein [Streptantibioticus silvisoli]|uniref:Nucleotidyltransferase domain-containing protein n=1 Tax=Streptantibioticus silvisoli TaxID=2705255 RepID=A0ABT6VTX5_9ACTN|nr:nucleotidyltransferase domain-containing protein [Streptantibioticus silvisoli]MDI5961615.1 nucleotidyltransferase domain-containing protein [Streptantibioticus silvisoli]
MNVLLSGVVGSVAHGLAHEGSDVDRLGMFAVPTERLHGLHRPRESHVSTGPDVTLHEAGKAVRLILACNPTAGELLWLARYETRTPLGDELVAMRGRLLSERAVRDAYLGYARQQFRKLLARDPATDPAKAAKHARHLVRLVRQAEQLHRTGHLTLRVEDPDAVRELGESFAAAPLRAETFLARAADRLDAPGVLPEAPDEAAADAWLRRVRAAFYRPGE